MEKITINWDEFDHIHVIKKLKQILNSWWNIDILFTNEKGELQGELEEQKLKKIEFSNPILKHFLSFENVKSELIQMAKEALKEIRQTKCRNVIKEWKCVGGLYVTFSSITIENEIMGTVIAIGFFDPSQESKKEYFKEEWLKMKIPQNFVEEALKKIKILKGKDKEHFIELVELTAQEIITLHEAIASRENRIKELNKELGSRYKYDNMIGESKPMQDLYSLLDKIKAADSTVLIQGENGTGKELIAKSIHYNSSRGNKSFVIQNCSSFNDNLLESELFGHVKGSFTGAIRDKMGLFEKADRGTFFLDEIGDTSTTMQVKLLRVLQEGTFTPVGGLEPKKVNVRVIAATNKDLKEMVEKGLFREDLYYRLNVINIHVPPLRERKEDISLLTEFFLNKSTNKIKKTITDQAMKKLYNYSWPGNIRELQNEMERLSVLSAKEKQITEDMLSSKVLEASKTEKRVQGARLHGHLKDAIEALERDMIQEGLRRNGWNKSKLAKELGISRAGLIMKVEKYNLDKRKLAR